MKTSGLLRQLGVAFTVALAAYVGLFCGIEGCRARRGPWQVTFTNSVAGAPMLAVNQPKLGITNVHLLFAGVSASTNPSVTLKFAQARPVPFDVPFGKCVFLDTLSLPGTVVLDLFGHEVQLLPRVLVIDRVEQAWRSASTLIVPARDRATETRTAPTPQHP